MKRGPQQREMSGPDAQLVYITVPDRATAIALAEGLVEGCLAAGANLAGPVLSVYRWQGVVRRAEEWQIFAQTANFGALRDWVASKHPHIVPCIISVPILAGLEPFLDWIRANGAGQCRQP